MKSLKQFQIFYKQIVAFSYILFFFYAYWRAPEHMAVEA